MAATIRELLSNRTIHYVQPDQTVFEAANYMVQCNVGAVPVLDGAQLVGIFSERDIMKRVVSESRDPMITRVAEVMTSDVHTVPPGTSCHEAMAMMQEYAVRHLPVCDGSTLVGFLSVRDLLRQKLDETTGEAETLRAYIQTGAS
jgi:CBS domain-containing protein